MRQKRTYVHECLNNFRKWYTILACSLAIDVGVFAIDDYGYDMEQKLK